MRLNQLEKKQKIILILVIIVFITIFILLFFLQPTNKYGDGINIKNYDKYISNLPTDRRDALNSTLYSITKRNLKSDNLNIGDATIRDGSVEYNYDQATNLHSGSFVVDMQSIKQSYSMSYVWSSDTNNTNLSGYTATASCLTPDKLIYGDFPCEDDFNNSKYNKNRDPILDSLPYSTFNYTITATINNDNTTSLDVKIFLYSSDTQNGGREASINKYKAEVTDWIKSISLKPEDYSINYTIN